MFMDSEMAPRFPSPSPSPLDCSRIIENLPDSARINIGEALRGDIPMPGERWAKRELEPMLEGAFLTGTCSKEKHVLEYRNLLADVVRYNHAGASKNLPEHIFARPENNSAELRERMLEKWAQRDKNQAWKDLREQKMDVDSEGKTWRKAVRAANKKEWVESESAVLDEFKEMLGHGGYAEQIQELANLQMMHDVQKAELNTRVAKPNALVLEACDKIDGLSELAEDDLCSLDTKAQVLGPLLKLSAKNMDRVHTRVGRLVARDVKDVEGRRQEVMARRLQHKDTLDFMFEAKAELEAAKALVNSTRKFVQDMEVELNEVGRAALDANSALKDARLAMAFQE